MSRLALILMGLLFVLGHPSYASPSSLSTFTLKNGMDCVLYPNKKVPLVTLVLTFKAGGLTETKATNGLTHLWEHMFFKGNKKYPDQEAFHQQIQNLGIVYNGDTSAEMVRYYFTLPSENLKAGLEFMYHAISGLKIDEKELKKEIKVVLDEYDRNASQPGFNLSRARKEALYGEKSYLRDPLGDRPTIAQTDQGTLIKIKNQVFIPENAALLISGYLDPKETKAMLENIFGDWHNPQAAPLKELEKVPAFPKEKKVLIDVSPKVKVSYIRYDFDGPRARIDVKDTHVADMLINLLGSEQGKFYKTYMESGLAHTAYLGYYTQAQAGEMVLAASADGKSLKKVSQMLLDEPKKWLAKDYFSMEEFKNARENLLIQHELEINKPSVYVKSLAFWWAITGLDYYNSYSESLRKVSLKDIHQFIKKYLIDKPYITSMLLSEKDAKVLGVKSNL